MNSRTIVDELSQRMRAIERRHQGATAYRDDATTPATTIGSFASLLGRPHWPTGCLVEWLTSGPGAGAATLALLATRTAWQNQLLVVIDARHEVYAPALAKIAGGLESVVFLKPSPGKESRTEMLWSLEQALRTPGVGAVWCPVERLSATACRRLQLAAETGGGLGLLCRAAKERSQPSFAEFRFLVTPETLPTEPTPRPSQNGNALRRWRVELLRARGEFRTGTFKVELSDGPSGLCLAAELASATPAA